MNTTTTRPVIGIAAPGDNLPDSLLVEAMMTLGQAGLEMRVADNVRMAHGRMAGDDKTRARGLMKLCGMDDVTQILMASGGYGAIRILPHIDWAKTNPAQPWIGYSDSTALLNARIAKTGVGGWHGPMLKQLAQGFDAADKAVMGEILRGAGPKGYDDAGVLKDVETLKRGVAHGRLIGGNLAVLRGLLGTPYAPVPERGDILFVEEICETNYRVDRDLEQLALAGWFDKLGGLVFGSFTDIQDSTSRPFGFETQEILARHAAKVKGPVIMGFPGGHGGVNMPLPVGSKVALQAGNRVSLAWGSQ